MMGHYKPGEHYTATEGEARIILPNLRDLCGLRHCLCWEARARPHLPTWSFAKVPRLQFPPEENARLLSVYMSPWALREMESTRYNPLLSLLGKCEKSEEDIQPIWMGLPLAAKGSAQDHLAVTGSAHDAASQRPPKRHLVQKEPDRYKCSYRYKHALS